jgi:hypothetical protein
MIGPNDGFDKLCGQTGYLTSLASRVNRPGFSGETVA